MYQKLILVGRLGQDPELKTVGQEQLCKFSVATSNIWVDQAGQKHEDTTWHNIDVWGKSAGNCAKFLRKGSTVMVEGEVKITKKEDKTYYGVKAYNVRFLDRRSDSESTTTAAAAPVAQATFTENDIPF
jgi:single-strand DNA-binding protein